jgi:hypothetical protein
LNLRLNHIERYPTLPMGQQNGVMPALTKVTLNLEEILISKSRIKILKALSIEGPLNLSAIKKCTGLNYKSTIRALEVLKHMKVVGEAHLGKTRSFRIRVENEKASAVKRLIKSLGGLQTSLQEGKEVGPSLSPENATRPVTRYKGLRISASVVS